MTAPIPTAWTGSSYLPALIGGTDYKPANRIVVDKPTLNYTLVYWVADAQAQVL